MMKKLFVALIIFVFIGILMLPVGENPDITPPDQVIEEYWELSQKGKDKEAAKLIMAKNEKDVKMLKEEEKKGSNEIYIKIDGELVKIGNYEELLRNNLQLKGEGYEEIEDSARYALFGTKNAIADVTLTKPDFEKAFEAFLTEDLNELAVLKSNGAGKNKLVKKAGDKLSKSLNEAEKITRQEKVILTLQEARAAGTESKWRIESFEFEKTNKSIDAIKKMMETELNNL